MSTPPGTLSSVRPEPAGTSKKGGHYIHARSADIDFGDRLADTRNLAHTEVPPPAAEQIRTAVGSTASEVADYVRKPARVPPGVPREQGWYR